MTLQGYPEGWDLRVAHAGRLTDHDHEVWGRPEPASPWRLELLVENQDRDQWVYRRNPVVRLPLARLGRRTAAIATDMPGHPWLPLLTRAGDPRAGDDG